ncbi:AcrR family transcriptional regulator [Pseudarthrobacter defluvii]|uniref:TetR/AcrR family transcriptional regulator n=1 Tax=Pseudarthrobacter defluvii TaxID=410837 RepID=UPI00278A633F|nr:TetR/AcrR family transcriptional regulator [Pseudarthrobacter defluvii]MDQ0771165.1 AcrR family transcriptional regulator [Pseudarthrobacter defluvii]
MPRISAATVAEHRAAQQRALLNAAHELLQETSEAPTMAEVAARAGLSRPSVYQYFTSRQDLLQALVRDVFPRWTERVTGAMAAAPTDADRVMAYAIANVDLVAEGAHAVGSALATLAPGAELDEQARLMHRQLQEPLIQTLIDLNIADPVSLAEMINSVVHAGTRLLESGQPLEQVHTHLHLLLGPFVTERRVEGSRRTNLTSR